MLLGQGLLQFENQYNNFGVFEILRCNDSSVAGLFLGLHPASERRDSRLLLQLSLSNPLKPKVMSRMKL